MIKARIMLLMTIFKIFEVLYNYTLAITILYLVINYSVERLNYKEFCKQDDSGALCGLDDSVTILCYVYFLLYQAVAFHSNACTGMRLKCLSNCRWTQRICCVLNTCYCKDEFSKMEENFVGAILRKLCKGSFFAIFKWFTLLALSLTSGDMFIK